MHDERKLAASTFGQRMLRALDVGDQLFSWAVRDDIDAIAARTGRKPRGGGIISADGTTAPGWRIVDPPEADAAWLPFFIQYNVDRAREMEGRRARYNEAASPAQPGGFGWVEIAGDEAVLRDWLPEDLEVRVAGGPPGLRTVGIESARGEIVLR